MSEAEYKRQIREELTKLGAKCIPVITAEMTEKGTPDIIGCFEGQMFVIEAKIYPNTASKIQEQRLTEWAKAGAIVRMPSYPYVSAREVAFGTVEASTRCT